MKWGDIKSFMAEAPDDAEVLVMVVDQECKNFSEKLISIHSFSVNRYMLTVITPDQVRLVSDKPEGDPGYRFLKSGPVP